MGQLYTAEKLEGSIALRNMNENPVVRVFCGNDITTQDREFIKRSFLAAAPKGSIHFNFSGHADLVVVLNYDPKLHWVTYPEGRMIKWLTEPVVQGVWSRRFSFKHGAIFNQIFTPLSSSQNREVLSPPFFPPRLSRDFIEKIATENRDAKPSKTHMISTVTSTLNHLEGHRFRNKLIAEIEQDQSLEVSVFGRGRTTLNNKEDALLPFMFSICVENSFQGAYWTEKLTDAFLCLTVPIYIGSAKVADYFPSESFIDASGMSELDFKSLITSLNAQDWEARLESLKRARELVLKRYNLGVKLAELAQTEGPSNGTKFAVTVTLDSFIALGLKLLLQLPGGGKIITVAKLMKRLFTKG